MHVQLCDTSPEAQAPLAEASVDGSMPSSPADDSSRVGIPSPAKAIDPEKT